MTICSECLYFSKWKKATADMGDCHANPPQMLLISKLDLNEFKSVRPRVKSSDLSCILFKDNIPF
jgi:hypothetical protein